MATMNLIPVCISTFPVILAFSVLFATIIITFLVRLYWWRRYILSLKAAGLSMPPYNILLGHLPIVTKIVGRLPSDAHGHYLPDQLRRAYPDLGPNFYLDLYPFAPSMLILGSPSLLYQATQQHPLPKHPNMTTFLKPLTEGLDIVTMEGQEWKKWRSIFNPGFSASHLMTLVPVIVKETEVFCEILGEYAESGKVVKMKDLTDNLTIDIIGKVTLNKELKSQRQPNELVDSIRKLIRWLSFGVEPNLFIRYHPLRPLAHWYYARIVNRYVSRELDERFSMQKPETVKSTRTVIDLALSTYQKEQTDSEARVIDPLFKRICMAQVKLFLFSGHDTTSSSICYILYLLSKHPSISAKVREEIKQTFHSTPDTSSIAQKIAKNPYLLNQLPYITAIIKESLRLFPVVSSTRCSPTPTTTLTDPVTNLIYPLSPFLIWINPHYIHHDPRLWVKPDEFIPERWLVGREDPLYPVTGAWRAFEHGARNCIGRELAMVEMKTVVCLVVGRFVVRDVYGEEDRTRGKGIKSVEGERAYQVQLSQQEGDLPCRIERIKE